MAAVAATQPPRSCTTRRPTFLRRQTASPVTFSAMGAIGVATFLDRNVALARIIHEVETREASSATNMFLKHCLR